MSERDRQRIVLILALLEQARVLTERLYESPVHSLENAVNARRGEEAYDAIIKAIEFLRRIDDKGHHHD